MTDEANTIDPTKTALLVMDYQPGIIKMIEAPEVLLAKAQQAIEVARAHGLTVGYVRVAFTATDVAAVPPTSRFSERAGLPHFQADAPETQVDDRLAPQPGDIVVRKIRVGAFSTTDLDTQLRAKDIDTLILAGISTSGVVLSTVRDASDKDYQLFVLADACADGDQQVHETLLQKVFPRQGTVITVDGLAAILSK